MQHKSVRKNVRIPDLSTPYTYTTYPYPYCHLHHCLFCFCKFIYFSHFL